MKQVVLTMFGLVAIVVVTFALNIGGLEWDKFFMPKRENVRREAFKNTQSYVQGKIQELVKYRLEYVRAKDNAEKIAIVSTIRLSFADFDKNKLPIELQNFLHEVMYK